MFYSCKDNTKINNLNGRWLRLLYGDSRLSFQEHLEKDESVSIHHKNIQIIAKEICKVKNVSLPKIFSYLFCETEITLLEDSIT